MTHACVQTYNIWMHMHLLLLRAKWNLDVPVVYYQCRYTFACSHGEDIEIDYLKWWCDWNHRGSSIYVCHDVCFSMMTLHGTITNVLHSTDVNSPNVKKCGPCRCVYPRVHGRKKDQQKGKGTHRRGLQGGACCREGYNGTKRKWEIHNNDEEKRWYQDQK